MHRYLYLVCVVLIAGLASAQSIAPSAHFGAQVDFTNANFPGPEINGSTALKDVYGSGIGGGAHIDIRLAMLSLRISGDYLKFSPDNDKYRQGLAQLIGTAADQFTVSGGGITLLSGNLNAKMDILPLPVIKPYITGGIGFGKVSVDDATVSQNGAVTKKYAGFSSETKSTWNIGAGVDLDIGVTLYLEVKYMWVMTDPKTSTMVPVSIGITF